MRWNQKMAKIFRTNDILFERLHIQCSVLVIAITHQLDMCSKLPCTFVLLAALCPVCSRTIKPFLPSCLSHTCTYEIVYHFYHLFYLDLIHAHMRLCTRLSLLFILQVTESWVWGCEGGYFPPSINTNLYAPICQLLSGSKP